MTKLYHPAKLFFKLAARSCASNRVTARADRATVFKLGDVQTLQPCFWESPESWPKSPTRGQERANVLVMVVATLRADHLSTYGYSRPTSPNLTSIDNQASPNISYATR